MAKTNSRKSDVTPNVAWTGRAEQRLRTALHRTLADGFKGDFAAKVVATAAELAKLLQTAFPEARDVIVLNYFVGFTHRPGEHILQVDVRKPDGNYVVKLADDRARLIREKQAWDLCGITGNNPVFMPLTACPDDKKPVAIAYQDAQEHIGAEEIVWLETAIQRCVRFGSPSLDSILDILHGVYGQLDARMYQQRCKMEPLPKKKQDIQFMPDPEERGKRRRLSKPLQLWSAPDPMSIRQRVNAAFAVGFTRFFDPVDYYRYLNEKVAAGDAEEVIPQTTRGLSHGDLHGRNALVGIDHEERANFAALFDYESISDDNLIGWDFVIMETELKNRIYNKIFEPANPSIPRDRRNLADFARQVQEFEWELAQATLHKKNWDQFTAAATTPRDRLQVILLKIRERAYHVLGRLRAHSIEWLREYLFLLGCYGLSTVRYSNQNEIERTTAYISAGVAAAFLEELRGGRSTVPVDPGAISVDGHFTYQRPLAEIHDLSRSDNPDNRSKAELLLDVMVKKYPAALHVWYEKAFNLIKQGQNRVPDALKVLKQTEAAFDRHLDQDTYALWGRCFKDSGDLLMREGLRNEAGSELQISAFREAALKYRSAIEKYSEAFEVAKGFFAGINVATLTFLSAGLFKCVGQSEEANKLREKSRQSAKELLAASSQWPELLPDDAVWTRATEAEAAMLCGAVDRAAARYEAALGQEQCKRFHAEAMGTQLRRIVEGYNLFGESVSLEPFRRLTRMWEFIQPEIKT